MATFKEAFATARKAGKATFTWNGGSYTTKTKEETTGKTTSPRPKAKPAGMALGSKLTPESRAYVMANTKPKGPKPVRPRTRTGGRRDTRNGNAPI